MGTGETQVTETGNGRDLFSLFVGGRPRHARDARGEGKDGGDGEELHVAGLLVAVWFSR